MLESSCCIIWRWQCHTSCRALVKVDTVNCETPLWHNVCAIVLVVWDCRLSSITNVCLSATSPTSDKHYYTEMRSDSVACVSAVCPLALHAERVFGLRARACLTSILTEFGHEHQCVHAEDVGSGMCGWGSCLHCICAPSEEEQTPYTMQSVHQSHICTDYSQRFGVRPCYYALPGQTYGVS